MNAPKKNPKKVLKIVSISALTFTLFFATTLSMKFPLHNGYAQTQDSIITQPTTLINTAASNVSSITSNNSNISIKGTGESKFVEPETLSTSSFPEAAKEITEPENPEEAKIKKERIEAKSLSEPGVSTSSLGNRVNITEFGTDQIKGIEAAAVQPSNQSLATSTQPSNQSLATSTQPSNQSLATSTQPSNQSLATSNMSPQVAAALGFEGRSQENSGGGYPPDATLAVGPNHVVQMVNTALQISDKAGSIDSMRIGTLKDFFDISTPGGLPCNPCDPFVLYDRSTDRYFASVLNVPDGTIRLAVTETADPTNIWNTFAIALSPSGSDCPDQPFIALSSDKLAIGANVYTNYCGEGNRFLGTQHIIVNKVDLISAGSNEPVFFASTRDPTGFSERPVKSFATSQDIILAGIGDGDEIDRVKMIKYSGQVPNVQSRIEYVEPIRTLYYPPPASQPTIDIPLDTTGRLQSASMSSDGRYIWLSSMVECVPRGDPNNMPRTCVRLIQFDPNTKQVMQDFDVAIRNLDLIYPSLTVTAAGDMVLAFGVSSSDIFPSLVVTRQSAGSNEKTLDEPELLRAGSSFSRSCDNPAEVEFPTCRYGDYFGASIDADPVDVHNAWVSGEYLIAPSIWGTFIAEVTP
jgi:hypothetical protein